MARHKFEQQFKKGLENREISPSPGGWDQLEKRLNTVEDSGKIKKFWWLGIAATLAAGIFIASLVFLSPVVEETPVIVETPAPKIDQAEPVDQINNAVAVEEEPIPQNNTRKKENVTRAVANAEVAEAPEIHRPETMVALESNVQEEVKNAAEEEMQFEYELPGRKLEEILAKVSSTEFTEAGASIEEVDALLYKAATEISEQQNNNYRAGTIHPNDLLFDVEMELEQSFRDRVFDVLKDGYLKARTAVANRNTSY